MKPLHQTREFKFFCPHRNVGSARLSHSGQTRRLTPTITEIHMKFSGWKKGLCVYSMALSLALIIIKTP